MKAKQQPPTIKTSEDKRRWRAYNANGSDTDAANALGLKRSTFAAWRMIHGLKGRGHAGRPQLTGGAK